MILAFCSSRDEPDPLQLSRDQKLRVPHEVTDGHALAQGIRYSDISKGFALPPPCLFGASWGRKEGGALAGDLAPGVSVGGVGASLGDPEPPPEGIVSGRVTCGLAVPERVAR